MSKVQKSKIAVFLKLANLHLYTGYCFRRKSATLLASSETDLLSSKWHGGWKSSTFAEGYVDEFLHKSIIAELFTVHVLLQLETLRLLVSQQKVVTTKGSRNLERLKRIKINILFSSMAFLGALLLGISIYEVNTKGTVDSKQLVLTHVISCHGIKSPVDTYPTDPYMNHTFKPNGRGRLTNEGKRELFRFGKELRERYGQFLGSVYDTEVYRSLSTDLDQTMDSVQLINAGLWEPTTQQKWGPLNWQPVPVMYQPLNQDKVSCPRYEIEREEVLRSKDVRKQLIKHQPLFKYFERSTGKSVKDFYDVQKIFGTLRAEKAFNLTLPKWTDGYFPEEMERLSAYSFKLDVYNKNLVRLTGGWLLKIILNDIHSKINESKGMENNRKMYLYGVHDRTIAMTLATLKLLEDDQVPDYAAAILIELHLDRSNNQFYIEVYYRKSSKHNFQLLTVPGCEKTCRLDKFSALTSDHIPGTCKEECRVDNEDYLLSSPHGP